MAPRSPLRSTTHMAYSHGGPKTLNPRQKVAPTRKLLGYGAARKTSGRLIEGVR